jgi:dCMP deaminase
MSSKDEKFMLDVAELAAERSSGVRMKVGAVVTDRDGNLVAFGYNGSVRGGDNCLEVRVYSYSDPLKNQIYPYQDGDGFSYRLETKESTIHAEQNCISHAARRGISIDKGKMYITHSPCQKCAAMMVQCGITEVVYKEKYRLFDEVEAEVGRYIKLTQWSSNDC